MLESILSDGLTISGFLICLLSALVLGLGTALLARFKSGSTQSFFLTLAILPAAVQTVILLVGGNLGAGVAVAGAFGLVRFRSAPGTAREITAIFIAMALGLACGLGYIVLAAMFFAVIAAVMIALTLLVPADSGARERTLKITIPENLDYDGLFDDLFAQYLDSFELDQVRTASMGTLYELHYRVKLKSDLPPKEFLDAIRCRNGNLNIICGRVASREAL